MLDELPLVRAGVRALLEPLVAVAGESHATREAIELVVLHRAALFVVGAPTDSDVRAAVVRNRALVAPATTVVLVGARDQHAVAALLQAGADVLLPRTARVDELADACKRGLDGARYVAPVLQRTLFGQVTPVTGAGDAEAAGSEGALSAREREVLACLAAGRSNREIAAELSVSLATVKSHLVHLYAKLGATGRADAVRAAVGRGLLA